MTTPVGQSDEVLHEKGEPLRDGGGITTVENGVVAFVNPVSPFLTEWAQVGATGSAPFSITTLVD